MDPDEIKQHIAAIYGEQPDDSKPMDATGAHLLSGAKNNTSTVKG